MTWEVVLVVAAGLVFLWLLLLTGLWLTQRGQADPVRLKDALRLLPDVLRLLRRLAGDKSLPGGVRLRLWLLLAYLLSPLDLVPDFIPVLGYADDAIIVAIALRSVIRAAGAGAIERHWPGTAQGLDALLALAGSKPGQPGRRRTMDP